MNFLTQMLHLVGSGAAAYVTANQIRDPLSRPNTLASLHLAEAGSVPFLEALRDRAEREGDDWLAAKLNRHAQDERRHAQIFAQGLKQLNKQVIDFSSRSQPQGEEKRDRRSPFFAAYFEGYTPADLKPDNIDWLVFLASTHILELDASRDFARMARVLPEDDPGCSSLKKGMLSVAQDEVGHAAYLKAGLARRLSAGEVETLIDAWRTRKVNALLAMVGGFLQKGGKMPSLVRDGAPVEVNQPEPQKVLAPSR